MRSPLNSPLSVLVATILLLNIASQQSLLSVHAAASVDTTFPLSGGQSDVQFEDVQTRHPNVQTSEGAPLQEERDEAAGKKKQQRTTRLKEYEDDPDNNNENPQDDELLIEPFTASSVQGEQVSLDDESIEDDSVEPSTKGNAKAGPKHVVMEFTEFDFDPISEEAESQVKRSLRSDETTTASSKKAAAQAFNIDFGFVGKITAAQKQGFLDARKRWQSIITKDNTASVCVPAGLQACGFRFPKKTCIDDLFIGVHIKDMDGVGNVAGSAGPCMVDKAAGKVRIGVMTFDAADANQLIKDGLWKATILHEMGHVLGIGTLWDYKKLITPKNKPAPFKYLGAKGNAALNKVYGRKGNIIVEDQGGYGTARAHWKEDTYDSELMTGYLEPKGKQIHLSAMTIQALADLGYEVDVSKADPYTLPKSSLTKSLVEEPTQMDAKLEKRKYHLNDVPFEWPITQIQEADGITLHAKEGREKEIEPIKDDHLADYDQ